LGSSTSDYSDFWRYTPLNDTWTQVADFGGSDRDYGIGFSIADTGYIGTGIGASTYKDLWAFFESSTVGYHQETLPDLIVYINPITKLLHISVNDNLSGICELKISDIAGRIVHLESFKGMRNTFKKQLSLTGWNSGVYFIALSTKENRVIKKLALTN